MKFPTQSFFPFYYVRTFNFRGIFKHDWTWISLKFENYYRPVNLADMQCTGVVDVFIGILFQLLW